jgi:hypothetical protein
MQRAKTFFYVSLGILALAVAFRLVVFQPGGLPETARNGTMKNYPTLNPRTPASLTRQTMPIGDIMSPGEPPIVCGVDASGTLVVATFDSSIMKSPARIPLPRAGSVIACAGLPGAESAWVLYDDGSFYRHDRDARWVFMGDLFPGNPGPVTPDPSGRIKAERR